MIRIMLLILLIFSITACGKEEKENEPEGEKLYYETLPLPSEKIDKIAKTSRGEDKDNIYFNGNNLQLIFDNYDYNKPLEPVKSSEEKTE